MKGDISTSRCKIVDAENISAFYFKLNYLAPFGFVTSVCKPHVIFHSIALNYLSKNL